MSSTNFANFLKKSRLFLLYILPPCLFLSYHPVITLASTDSMNLELSLPLIWLVLYDLVSLIDLFHFGLKKTFRGLSDRTFFIFSLFPLYSTLSIFWSANPLRAVLTAGVIWALFIAIFATYQLFISSSPSAREEIKAKFLDVLYFTTTIACIFCWLQCGLDLLGLGRSQTLLCAGCTYHSFGFPHPNGFAIEPQFMGNLLLASCILKLVGILKSRRLSIVALIFELFYVSTLFLTFSRGAIYSFLVAVAVLIIYFIIRRKSALPLLASLLIIASFCFTLTGEATMAALSPTSDTFSGAAAKVVHHLSLGKIDFRPSEMVIEIPENRPTPVKLVENSSEPVENSPESTTEPDREDSRYDGYVPESTTVRLSLTDYALKTWSSSPSTILFGVGLGGAGRALAAAEPSLFTAKEIVQNQYASLLLELGLAGLATTIAATVLFLRHRRSITFYALAAAYATSLLFFSGLPNALHIYFLLAFVSML